MNREVAVSRAIEAAQGHTCPAGCPWRPEVSNAKGVRQFLEQLRVDGFRIVSTALEGVPKGAPLSVSQRKMLHDLVLALRSGEYRQGRGSLIGSVNGAPAYCCLGVAGRVAGRTDADLRNMSMLDGAGPVGFFLDPATAQVFGFTREEQGVLGRLNDMGRTFEEIADEIVTRWPDVFIP